MWMRLDCLEAKFSKSNLTKINKSLYIKKKWCIIINLITIFVRFGVYFLQWQPCFHPFLNYILRSKQYSPQVCCMRQAYTCLFAFRLYNPVFTQQNYEKALVFILPYLTFSRLILPYRFETYKSSNCSLAVIFYMWKHFCVFLKEVSCAH